MTSLNTTGEGYAIIALDNPKSAVNVGGALRAIKAYGAKGLFVSGNRFGGMSKTRATDTGRAWRETPILRLDSVLDANPYSCQIVAVELLEDAEPLPSFRHPERAVYVFGAEDATLGRRITERAHKKVFIPTHQCMNLAAAVNVVLYDRLSKSTQGKENQ